MGSLPKIDSPFFAIDKLAHLLIFMVWEIIFIIESRKLIAIMYIFAVGVAFGFTTEFLQIFTKDRIFDLVDALYDSFGLILGVLFFQLYNAIMKFNKT
jgi:VanZ family protein